MFEKNRENGDGSYTPYVVAVNADGTAIGGGSGGGGGAVTVADGADVNSGATTDAVVAAGAAGTESAKLRAISRDTGAAQVSVASLDTKATARNTSLASIDSKTATLVSGFVPVVLQSYSSANLIGRVSVGPNNTTGNYSTTRVVAAASTNGTLLKSTFGGISTILLTNTAAYAVYLKIYNKSTAPTVGTDTPAWSFAIPAGGTLNFVDDGGLPLGTGIGYGITKGIADSDTTATVANDIIGVIKFY